MAETSGITWTDATFNPWIGCQKVSEECELCYAESDRPATVSRAIGLELWGPAATSKRRVTAPQNWQLPIRLNRQAQTEGRRIKLFCASQADVFETFKGAVVNHKNEPMRITTNRQLWWEPVPAGHHAKETLLTLDDMRRRLWEMIEATPFVDWLLLTKRPENVMGMVPEHWRTIFPKNVWMGTTVGLQKRAKRLDALVTIPAWIRWVSAEPLLGPLDLRPWLPRLQWVIGGGESGDAGQAVRPTHPAWAEGLRDQCVAADVPYHFKQWGEYVPIEEPRGSDLDRLLILDRDGEMGYAATNDPRPMLRVGKKAAGRVLDGKVWHEFPVPAAPLPGGSLA